MHMRRWFIGSLVAFGTFTLLIGSADFAGGKDKKVEAKKPPEIGPREGKRETIKLFNGKDLEGWEGYADLWSVKDETIIARNKERLKVSTYLFTKKNFSDFRLIFSAKLGEINEMHSGVALWGKKITAPDKGLDPVKEHGEHTYQGHLVMFPPGWGLVDLHRR